MGDVIEPGDLCSRAATLKGYFYTNLGGTLIRIGAKVIRYRLEDIGKALRKHYFVEAESAPQKEAAK